MSLRLASGLGGFFALAAAGVNFDREVAPILARHCVECHRPGEVAPFSLLTQNDAARHARTITQAVRARRMPPWKPQPLAGIAFEGERRLSNEEIRVMTAWGREAHPGPGALTVPPRSEWALGVPDVVVEMAEAFPVSAAASDTYQCFVVPLPASMAGRWVRAFEFQPGERRVVHHALALIDSSGAARARDAATPGPGYRCFGVPGFLPSAAIGGWSPGNRAYAYATGTAVRLPARGDVVFQIHYHASGKPESDRSRLGLYFASEPPSRQLVDIPLGSRQIDIRPGERHYRVRDGFTLPVDVEVVSVIPHAHYLARRMRGWVRLPGGSRQELLRIEDWDFNWQESYRYRTPVRLRAGARLEMDFEYDNSSRNPRNPARPPRRVGWGPETTDEMAGLHFAVLPVRPGDHAELARTLWGKMIRFLQSPLP